MVGPWDTGSRRHIALLCRKVRGPPRKCLLAESFSVGKYGAQLPLCRVRDWGIIPEWLSFADRQRTYRRLLELALTPSGLFLGNSEFVNTP